jgi:hypothetical protein
MVWFVAGIDDALRDYLNVIDLEFPILTLNVKDVSESKIGPDKIQYPAYRVMVYSYVRAYYGFDGDGKYQNMIHDHFKKSNIKVLNMDNTLRELRQLPKLIYT